MDGITKELRESMIPCISDGWLTITKSAFECVADRIDSEHERVRAESIIDMTDESMAEHGAQPSKTSREGIRR